MKEAPQPVPERARIFRNVICDGCGETFYLDEDEVAQGSYVCPACGKTLEFEFEDDCDCGCHHHGEDADEDDELKF